METLADSDLRRLQVFLEQTSVACDLSSFVDRMLPAIDELIGSDMVCHAEVDPQRAKLVSQTLFAGGDLPDNPAYVQDTFERLMFTSPIFRHWTASGEMSALRNSQFMSLPEWHDTPLYQEVYKLWRTEDSLAIPLPAPPNLVACFCIERSRVFDDREQLLMDIVRPHLAYAYRNAEALSLLSEAGAASGTHSILLDEKSNVVQASEAAIDLLSCCFPAEETPPFGLPESLHRWVARRLRRFDPEMPEMDAPLLARTNSGQRVSIRLLPAPSTGAQALLILREFPNADTNRLATYVLSAREKEVLTEAAQGLSSKEIAESLVISRRTVEKHLESIYNKLGVDSRAAAIAKVLAPD